MLKDSLINRLFIRFNILLLRSITPLSIIYCITRLIWFLSLKSSHQHHHDYHHLHNSSNNEPTISSSTPTPNVFQILDIYATLESLFYICIYIPRKHHLNRQSPTTSPPTYAKLNTTTREHRRLLFRRTWESTPDPRRYLCGWFPDQRLEEIGRESVREWVWMRFWGVVPPITPLVNEIDGGRGDSRSSGSGKENESDNERNERKQELEDELEEYVLFTEKVCRVRFVEGRGKGGCMAVTFEDVRMQHRPLLWYVLFIGAVDTIAILTLTFKLNFQFHSTGLLNTVFSTFPFRPLTLLIPQYKSPTTNMTYFHHPHTSTNHVPVLFIHGIGVGQHTYLPFFSELLSHNPNLGIIALEIPQVCSRICPNPPLSPETMTETVHTILTHHNWNRVVCVTHSYGSIISAQLLHNPLTANLIGPNVFVDPVTFSFHPPEVPFNFLRRQPRSASEIELQYFASLDPDVARALTRGFGWIENSLFVEDIQARKRVDVSNKRVDKAQSGSGGSGGATTTTTANDSKDDNSKNHDKEYGTEKNTIVLAGKDIITDVETLGQYLNRIPTDSTDFQRGVKQEMWYKQEERKLEKRRRQKQNQDSVRTTSTSSDSLTSTVPVVANGSIRRAGSSNNNPSVDTWQSRSEGTDTNTNTNTNKNNSKKEIDNEDQDDEEWKFQTWTGHKPIEILYYPDLNHAEVFDDKKDRGRLIDVIDRYSREV